MSFFNPDIQSPLGCPQSVVDLIVAPLLFAFFGIMIFIGAVRFEATYDKEAKWWKTCFIPLGLALLLGLQKVIFLTDYGYRQTVVTRKLYFGHYGAFVIPVVCIVAILLYQRLQKAAHSRRVY